MVEEVGGEGGGTFHLWGSGCVCVRKKGQKKKKKKEGGGRKEHIDRRTAKACWEWGSGEGPGGGASELEHFGNLPGEDVAPKVAVDGGLPVDRLLQVQIPASGPQLV